MEQSAELSVDALLASYATDLTVMPARVALDGGVVINEEIALDGAEEALMYKGAVGGGRPMMMMARGGSEIIPEMMMAMGMPAMADAPPVEEPPGGASGGGGVFSEIRKTEQHSVPKYVV